ncbi:hypothetical protein NDU88_002653 [Pleurodeles waltl]|uniref:Uncharacterized protein n=1 Tax=Pleurodeles waltl TaxID=8319 RepID=A0AAV7PA05_PLEWA|nr:hypothetical protein NDU88_002653 [Pleurodeles waltl]
MEGQRHRDTKEHETKMESWRVIEQKGQRRRRTAEWKIPAQKEGEDAQRPATFREERGQLRVLSPGPQWKYPEGTSQFMDAVQEEAEPQGSGCRQEETEIKGVKNPVSPGTRRPAAEVENGGTTASGDEGARGLDGIVESHRAERPEEDGSTEYSCTE